MSLLESLSGGVYGLPQAAKETALLAELNALTRHHVEHCPPYARMMRAQGLDRDAASLEAVPFLPVALFKTHRLVSIPESELFKTITSSGTTGQAVSRIALDRTTAQLQQRALAAIMAEVLGRERLPMIIIDTASTLRDRRAFNARAAGILGMMTFGRQHVFALDDEMRLDGAGLEAFLDRFGGAPILLFGFTFMVWRYFAPALAEHGLAVPNGILVHSGGWKKLAEQAVDNASFKRRLLETTGIARVYNFYGMAEQVGSVFLEGEDGLLYPPRFADVIIRDPISLEPLPVGATGVIQVLSALPRSYPGHSLLTSDLGRIDHIDGDAARRHGKGFTVLGRVPTSELRGCSDVHAAEAAA